MEMREGWDLDAEEGLELAAGFFEAFDHGVAAVLPDRVAGDYEV
jgi:hypothetical protein